MIHRLSIETENETDVVQIKAMAERLGASITITPKQGSSASAEEMRSGVASYLPSTEKP